MTWCLREIGKNDAYQPLECLPDSGVNGYFTLKNFHGGKMQCYPHGYVGGTVRYVDKCDGDTMSLFEVQTMLDECGENGEELELFFRSPCTEMEFGLWAIESDQDVMRMCRLVSDSRVMYLYAVKQREVTQSAFDFFPSPDPDFLFDPNDAVRIAFEKKQEIEILELEGMYKDFSDVEDTVEPAVQVNLDGAQSDGEHGSFHDDSSNKDNTDNEGNNILEDAVRETNVVPENCDDDNDSVSDVSKYGGSEDERMAANSTDEEEACYPVFNEETEMTDPKFTLGMLFSSGAVFREAVKKFAILDRRPVKRVRNWGIRAKYICSAEGCNWYIYASPMQNSQTFQVMAYTPKHNCSPTFNNKQLKSGWIATHYENDIRLNPTWPINSFHKKVINDWKCEVSVHAIGRAKRLALDKINGRHAEQYGLVCSYVHELRKCMPDSTVELVLDDLEAGQVNRRFKRLYICLGPVRRGFVSGCRPLIGLDGCHLNGPYGGQLLSAVGTDCNDGMYPLAWAVVEAENNETWNWFLQLVATDVGIENSHAWTFISDRQKGLINALENVVPNAEHRFCVMHLYRNMWKNHKGLVLRKCLWRAARATTEYMFDKHMAELQKMSKKCHDWLMEKPRSQWTRSAFRIGCLSDMFVNNHSEAFNSSIKSYRELPIIKMLQSIHLSVMIRIQQRRDKMLKSYALNPICPNAMRKVNKALSFVGGCDVSWSGESKYNVKMTEGGYLIVVDLAERSCACRKYQLTGLPCVHAAAAIDWRNLDMQAHIHPTYRKDMFLECYRHTVSPMSSEHFWEKSGVPKPLPPAVKIAPGRPKKKRVRTSDVPTNPTVLRRQNTTGKCTYCSVIGHNSRTCAAKKSDKGLTSGASSNPEGPKKKATAPKKKSTKTKNKSAEAEAENSINVVTDKQIVSLNSLAKPDGATQGGVFTSYTEQVFVQNTTLGVQPTRFSADSSVQLTTLAQLQAAKKARGKEKQVEKQPWKL